MEETKFEKELVNGLISNGYVEFDRIILPDGEYYKNGGGYQFQIDEYDSYGDSKGTIFGYAFTGWQVITPLKGIRGFYNHEHLDLKDGRIIGESKYRVFTNNKDIIREFKINQILNE